MRKVIVTLLIFAAFACGACGGETNQPYNHPDGHSQQAPEKADTGKPQLSQDKSQDVSNGQVPTGQVEGDVRTYYNAATAGDYDYTFEHLTSTDQTAISRSQWRDANEALESDQGTYEIVDIRPAGSERFEVELLVSNTPRTTYFVSDEEASV